MKKTMLFIGLLVFVFTVTYAQVPFKINQNSTMSISGTSTIHDWTSTVNEISGTYVFKENVQDIKFPKSGSIVDNLIMIVPVKSIISTRGTTMDNKTYNALKSEEFPEIIFEIKKDNIKNLTDAGSEVFQLEVTGPLSIAGHTKEISLLLEGHRIDYSTLKFKGSYPIDMVAYEIEPPTAMFGQIKTGKDVTIDFEMTLVKE